MSKAETISREREAMPLLFMAMETAWLIAVFDLLDQAAGSPARLSPGWSCILYPAAYFWGRLVRPRGLSRFRGLLAALVPAILATALTAKLILLPGQGRDPSLWTREVLGPASWPAWLLIPGCGGFVWLRGWYLSGRRVDFKGLAGGFQMGLAVFLAALPFSGLMGASPARIWALLSGFFVFGLGGLWLGGRMRPGDRRGESGTASWLVLLILSLGAVLVLGFALWSLVDRELLEILVAPVIWLWERFMDLMAFIGRILPKPEPVPLPDKGAAAPHLAPPPFKGLLVDLAWLRRLAELLFITATLTIVGMALFRSLTDLLKWLGRRLSGPSPEAVTASDYGLLDDLKALLRGLYAWLRRLLRWGRKKEARGPAVSPQAKTVRDIYRRFLIWGGNRGRPRAPSRTPYEYQAEMSRILPGREDDLGLLTEAYVMVRYGGAEPGPDLINLVRAAWKNIRSSKPIQQTKEAEP